MMSWSYQSSNPCTVLVKEKPDSHHVDCSPSTQSQSSTNRPNQQQDSSVSDQQQDSVISSSMGNIIGGKKGGREKRHVLDVVVDDDVGEGHENKEEEDVVLVERRVLVNISIGMDRGIGSNQQEVYNLQVAVPLKSDAKNQHNNDFYTYKVHENDDEENFLDVFINNTMTTERRREGEEDEKEIYTTTPFDLFTTASSSSFPCDCCEGLRS